MSEPVLEPEAQAFADAVAAPPFVDELGPERARKVLDDLQAQLIEMAQVEETWVTVPAGDGSVRVRVVTPRGTTGTLPVVLYLHGGGWVLGSRDSTASAVRFLATHADVEVLSVDYRLAPEHPFPAGLDDARAAWEYAVEHAPSWGIDPRRLVVAGDSAGGNLSAVLALDLRGEEVQPCLQLLFFPVTDLSRRSGSYREFADGFFLTAKQMDWYAERYLADPAQASDPRVSPLLADDLSGAAPAYVAVAGFDPLRDEGLAYAERLRQAGVATQVERAGELIHAFINITGVSPGARAETLKAARAVQAAVDAVAAGEE